MTAVKVKVNQKAIAQLKSTINEVFGDTVVALNEKFEEVIEDPYAFSAEGFNNWDIVDTGRLRVSQMVSVISQGPRTTAYWQWDPVDPETRRHYAGDVFAGFLSFAGNWIPGRDWPGRAVERLDPLTFFAEALKKRKI